MIKIGSSQFSFRYGNEVRFPYSIATLVSYCKTNKHIKEHCFFEKTYLFREKIEEYIEQSKDLDVLLCSCYIWNWEITLHLAREVRKINPNCFIIFGGPNVPNDAKKLLEENDFISMAIHGEGEKALHDVLLTYIFGFDQFAGIPGVEFNGHHPRTMAEKLNDLEDIPSPYTTNLVWDLVEKVPGVEYIVSWETNRGCPFNCTFCDWGSGLSTKMRKFGMKRLYAEMEWFGDNLITYIEGCDSNFGIFFDRDLEIATRLKEIKLQKGYPIRFRPSWAKTKSEKVIAIAKELQQADLLKAVTFALQSLDEKTLENVKRKNIEFDKYANLTKIFKDSKIPTYTELIMGLPGETLASFKSGLETVMANTEIGTIYTYNCTLIVNSEMANKEYMEKHKVKSLRSPIYLTHSKAVAMDIQEYEDIVVETYSYTTEELKKMYLYSWMVQTFYSFGIMDLIMKFYKKEHGFPYMRFFEALEKYLELNGKLLHNECKLVKKYIDDGFSGKGWDHSDFKLGEINWSIEEASWLRLVENGQLLANDIHDFIMWLDDAYDCDTNIKKLNDLICFQVYMLSTKDDRREQKENTFEYDWKNYFLDNNKKTYSYKNKIKAKDSIEWNYEAIWYGRSMRKYKTFVEDL